MNFFTRVFDILFPSRDTELLVRDTDFTLFASLLDPQIISIQNTSVLTLLPYRSPLVQAFIIEAKFHNNKKAQRFLGEIICTAIKSNKVVFLPLPLGVTRRKERGYNQTEEILKSTHLAQNSRILARTRETTPQTTLGREARIQNMTQAFSVISAPDPDLAYILLDDVVTTGATLLAAYEVLVKAGAKEVFMVALAH